MKIVSDSPMVDLVQISTERIAGNGYKQSTTMIEARRIQYYTVASAQIGQATLWQI